MVTPKPDPTEREIAVAAGPTDERAAPRPLLVETPPLARPDRNGHELGGQGEIELAVRPVWVETPQVVSPESDETSDQSYEESAGNAVPVNPVDEEAAAPAWDESPRRLVTPEPDSDEKSYDMDMASPPDSLPSDGTSIGLSAGVSIYIGAALSVVCLFVVLMAFVSMKLKIFQKVFR